LRIEILFYYQIGSARAIINLSPAQLRVRLNNPANGSGRGDREAGERGSPGRQPRGGGVRPWL